MKFLPLVFVICYTNLCICQLRPVDVAELTIKVAANSTEELYYGFQEGDQILFSFEETEGKELKEIQILEYPGSSKFMDYETKKVDSKTINVVNKSVYVFRFKNTNLLKPRICKIKIRRIPETESKIKFNTNIRWISVEDTMSSDSESVPIGYDTVYSTKTKKVLDMDKKYEELLLDKTQKVNSQINLGANKSCVSFDLPLNEISKDEHKKVIAWAYWIGVGEESNIAWQKNFKGIVNGVAGLTMSPLGAFAVGAVTNLIVPSTGEDVSYYIVDTNNKNLFFEGKKFYYIDSGKGKAGYKKFLNSEMLQGQFHIILYNDNYIQGIDASVKVTSIIEHKKFRDEQYTDLEIRPRYDKKVNNSNSKISKIPVTFDFRSN